jgi:hypothetical protein
MSDVLTFYEACRLIGLQALLISEGVGSEDPIKEACKMLIEGRLKANIERKYPGGVVKLINVQDLLVPKEELRQAYRLNLQ